MTGALSIWVVYSHPRDYPGKFVARRWEGERPTADVVLADDIEDIRDQMLDWGLAKLMPMPGDDPGIVETWL